MPTLGGAFNFVVATTLTSGRAADISDNDTVFRVQPTGAQLRLIVLQLLPHRPVLDLTPTEAVFPPAQGMSRGFL